MSVQVLFCTCGETLRGSLDFDELKSYVRDLDGVTEILTVGASCTKAVKDELVEAMTGGGEKVVALACTRSVCGKPLESVLEASGLDPQNLVILNAKEQIAWVHPNLEQATEKAKRLLAASVAKARSIRPVDTIRYDRYKEALVVGAGIAGLTAAGELVEQGFKVHVVERKPVIGGAMPLISKTHPEEDCSRCLRGPRMVELLTKRGITYHVSTEVKLVEKTPRGFRVTLETKPVKLDMESKTEKGLPVEAIPVSSDDGFKLVYRSGPTKESLKAVVDSRCGSCASVFPTAQMSFDEKPGLKTIEVGTVVLATGFQDFDPTGIPKWGYGLPNVITQYQLARLLDPLGPTSGGLVRPSDMEKPSKIVMVQCVGSRDPEFYADCSKYCCLAAIKHGTIIKKFKNPDADVTILFRDIRASGYEFEALYNEAKALGVGFTHGDIIGVETQDNDLLVNYVNGMGEPKQLKADLIVLSTGMTPADGSDQLAEIFNVETTESGFMKEVDEKVANTVTRAPGVYIAGACAGPKNIPDSVAQAGAAAFMAGSHLRAYVEKKANHPIVDEENCGKCGICRSVCPYEAIIIPEDGYPQFNDELCQSCGLCVSSCPTKALKTPNFGFDVIDEQVRAITDEKKGPLIVGFLCDDCGYNLLDTAGFNKTRYTASFMPVYVNCMSNLSLRNVLNAIRWGADAVILVGCVKDRCHFLKGTQRSRSQMDIIGEFFETMGIETPIRILESSGTMVSQFIEALVSLEEKLKEAG